MKAAETGRQAVLRDLDEVLGRLLVTDRSNSCQESKLWGVFSRPGWADSIPDHTFVVSIQLVGREPETKGVLPKAIRLRNHEGRVFKAVCTSPGNGSGVFRAVVPQGILRADLPEVSRPRVLAPGDLHADSVGLRADSDGPDHTITCQTGKAGFQADLRVRKDGKVEIEVCTNEAEFLKARVSFRLGAHRVDRLKLMDGKGAEEVAMTPEEIEGFDGWLDDFRVES